MCDAVITTNAGTGARADFQRARRAHLAARARRRLTARRARPNRPRHLGDVAALFWRPARRRSIPLEAIVGTVDSTADFDADFRPATDRVASRWQSIARAHGDGRALPPIAVIERQDGYYILDGRHRVSVARALGQREIDAWTSPAPRARPSEPPTNQQTPTPYPTHRVRAAIARPLRAHRADAHSVHFHAGDHGRPYVCENPRCGSPSLHIAPS